MTPSSSPLAPARLICDLSENPSLAASLGRLTILRDLIHLYGHTIAHESEERVAVAHVFAQIVEQQQKLIIGLDRAGVSLDMRRANRLPEDAPPEIVFRHASHEVLREEILLVQDAKEAGGLTRLALGAHRRLTQAMLAIIASTPDVPLPQDGWIPSPRQARRPFNEVVTYVLSAVDGPAGRTPVLVAMGVDVLRQAIPEATPEESVA